MKLAHVFLAFLAVSAVSVATAEFEEVSIWDALSASKEHTVLTETLDFLGLAEVLGETNLTLTLLSPTDLAFDIFFKALGLEGNVSTILNAFNIDALAEVIGYHFLVDAIPLEYILDNNNKTIKEHTLAGNVTVHLFENHSDGAAWVKGRTGESMLREWTASEQPYPSFLYPVDKVLLPRKYSDFPGY
ncbi:hypothetical protein QBZ16_000553 [Prototheca wickerhamii]|uniref:FAS1 domain-containing protein n=1 Tax=Prototheca wickerhamii TaxID=3111 RepID=A0AAD9MIV4_PROWI|nr:hypothetical protein QBZ16_000553 [Prototheca wickerhamii]